MSWPRFAIGYRHTVYALLIAVVVFGIAARFGLPVQLFPDTDPPTVTVITPYPGMAAPDVAKNVSKLLEAEIAGEDGVRRVESTNQTGLSVVQAEFHYSRSGAAAVIDVQNAVNRIRGELPAGVGEPEVVERSASDRPIVTVAVTGNGTSLDAVREWADNQLRDRLQLVEGVSTIDVLGGHKRQLRVDLHPRRMADHGIDAEAVRRALRSWNLTEAGGRIRRGSQELVVRFDAPLRDAADAAALPVARDGDGVVRLGDVAELSVAPGEDRSAFRFNGAPAVGVQVLKRGEANTVSVAARVRAALDELAAEHPEMRLEIADDGSVFTRQVIDSMTGSVLTAIALTVAVVLLFLGNFRRAAIIAVSIPVAFLATFSAMYLAGIELNMVTMSAIILSIGLLVDGAIVVIENIHRHLEAGAAPPEAAMRGAEELFTPVLAGLATTLAVLIPLGFLGGFIGRLFGPLAWTLVFALTFSFVVAMTVIPLLAAAWLRSSKEGSADAPGREPHRGGVGAMEGAVKPPGTDSRRPPRRGFPARSVCRAFLRRTHYLSGRLNGGFAAALNGLRDAYLTILDAALARPRTTVLLAVVLFAGAVAIFGRLGSEMLPRYDTGTFQIIYDAVPGTPLERTAAAVAEIEAALGEEPEVVRFHTRIGYEPGSGAMGKRGALDVNQAEITVELTPRDRRDETIWAVMDRVRAVAWSIPGTALAITEEQGATARAGTAAPVAVRISGPDPAVLDRIGDAVAGALAAVPGIVSPHRTWALDTPQADIRLDRRRVDELGLDGAAVARAVFTALEGEAVTPYRQERHRDLDIFLRYAEPFRDQREDLEDVRLALPGGGSVPLREVATVERTLGPRIATRDNHRPTLEVRAYHRDRPLSDVVSEVQARLQDLEIPPGHGVGLAGEQEDFEEAQGRMRRALAISVLAVYLVLLAQMRSFRLPVTIMAAVPLQLIGVALALLLTGKYLSMPALLGLILLVGMVVNNSIVLLDFALAAQREGAAVNAALREAVAARFRPIMMTTFSTVAGMLPLALEMAVGSERFSPIATVIIGGIVASTLLTLVVVPALFRLLGGGAAPDVGPRSLP